MRAYGDPQEGCEAKDCFAPWTVCIPVPANHQRDFMDALRFFCARHAAEQEEDWRNIDDAERSGLSTAGRGE